MKRTFGALAAAAGALLLGACGGLANPSSNTIVPFTVTVQPSGSAIAGTFAVHQIGEFSMSVKAITPDAGSIVSIVVAADTGGLCGGVLQENPTTGVGLPGVGTTLQVGDYCVVVLDPIALGYEPIPLPQAETVTLSVSYP